MKNIIQSLRRVAIIAFFAAATTFIGCNAMDLAGPDDPPQTEKECPECSNGRNL